MIATQRFAPWVFCVVLVAAVPVPVLFSEAQAAMASGA